MSTPFVKITAFKSALVIEGPDPGFEHEDWLDLSGMFIVRNTAINVGVSREAKALMAESPKVKNGYVDWTQGALCWSGSPWVVFDCSDGGVFPIDFAVGPHTEVPNDVPPKILKELQGGIEWTPIPMDDVVF